MSSDPVFAGDVGTTTEPIEKEETKTRVLPPYHVILENDNYHSMEFVISVLQKALGYTSENAFQLMMLAHSSGQAVVWTMVCNCALRCSNGLASEPSDAGSSNTMYLTCCHSASTGCTLRTMPESVSNVPRAIHNSPSSAVLGSLAVNHAGAATERPLRKRKSTPSHSARTPSNFSLTR